MTGSDDHRNGDEEEAACENASEGEVEEARERYDATELVKRLGKAPVHVLVDYVS